MSNFKKFDRLKYKTANDMAMADMDLCAKYKAQQNIPHNSAALSY